MRGVLRALIVLPLLISFHASAADEKLTIDLNSVEPSDNRCVLNFVIENKGDAGLESLKLDLVYFGVDGGITRRRVVELGPVRAMKTSVRTWLIDVECKAISSILVNDVTACLPGNPSACLDALGLSSRVKEIRLYK